MVVYDLCHWLLRYKHILSLSRETPFKGSCTGQANLLITV